MAGYNGAGSYNSGARYNDAAGSSRIVGSPPGPSGRAKSSRGRKRKNLRKSR